MKFKIGNLLCALCVIGGSTRCRADLLAHGTADMYWIAQIRPDQNGAMRTIIRQRSLGQSPDWTAIAQINAKAISLANRGTQLAVLLDNGDWTLVWDGGSSTGPLPDDGAALEQLSGSTDTMWAIARAQRGRQPSTRGATQPAATMPAGTLLLYRLEQGRWSMLAPLPPIAAVATDISLAVFDRPMLALLSENGRVETYDFDLGTRAWHSLGAVTANASTSEIKLLPGQRRPFLWAGEERSGGMLFGRSEHWSAGLPLTIPPAELGDGVEDVAIAGQSVRILAQGPGKIIEHSFTSEGKDRRRVDMPAVIAPPGPGQVEWVSAITLLLLMYVVLSTFRRRTPVSLDRLEAAGMMLAPPPRRLIAGLFDALPLLVTGAVVFARLPADKATDSQAILDTMHYPMLIAAAVYIGHILICELAWGWSLGKKLCGLRVTMLDGSAPPARAIVVRNMLRIIDLSMLFLPVMLVIASPLRQRVGDVAAETIVVMKGAAQPKKD